MIDIKDYILEGFRINKDTDVKDRDPEDPSTWEEGDILSGTSGYSMTIPYFFKIIKKTPSGFSSVKLSKKLDSGHYNGSFTEVPDDSKLEKDLKGKVYRTIVRKGKKWCKVDDVFVHLWNGKPVHGDDMD